MEPNDPEYDLNQDILLRIRGITTAMKAATAVIPRVFAQMAERAYGDASADDLAIRVLDVDSEARETILAEAYALSGIMTVAPSGYIEDEYSREMEAAGFGLKEVGLAFHAVDDAAVAAMRSGIGERQGEILGVPLTVIKGREVDVRCAAAWLRARPAAADHWALLDTLLTPA